MFYRRSVRRHGYPTEVLDLDLDLEADLGIDTVKQAELFASIREHFDIPRREDLRLSDYNTLAKLLAFVEVELKASRDAADQVDCAGSLAGCYIRLGHSGGPKPALCGVSPHHLCVRA